MACYLAPEKPLLSSVISENYFQRVFSVSSTTKTSIDRETLRFADDYQHEFCFHLGQHAEINPDHRFCWIGDESRWSSIVQEKLFLNKKIDFIHCDSERSENVFIFFFLLFSPI